MTEAEIANGIDKLVTARGVAQRMLTRIDQEPVTLMVGTGLAAGEIALSKDYMAGIIKDVRNSLMHRIAEINRQLTEAGFGDF